MALSIGISEELFWTLNPHKLKPYIKANELREERKREEMNVMAYVQGIYVRDALLCTVGNMFKSKGKPYEYPEEPHELFGVKKKIEEEVELTEDDKIARTDALFTRLSLMKDNYELSKL